MKITLRVLVFKLTAGLTAGMSIGLSTQAENLDSEFTCNQGYTGLDTWYGDDHYKLSQEADQYAIPLRLQYKTAGADGTYPPGDGTLVTFFCTDQTIDATCDIEPYFLKNKETHNDKYWDLRNVLKGVANKNKLTGYSILGSNPVAKINSNFSLADADWVLPCEWEFKRKVEATKKQYTDLITKNYSEYIATGVANTGDKATSVIEEKNKKLKELESLLPTNADECNNKKFTFSNSVDEIWGTDIFNEDSSLNTASGVAGTSLATAALGGIGAGVIAATTKDLYTGFPDHWGETDGSGGREAKTNTFNYEEQSGDIDDSDVQGILNSMSSLHTTCVMPAVSSPNTVFGLNSGTTFSTFAKLDVKQAEYSSKNGQTDNKSKLVADAAKDEAAYAETRGSAATASGTSPGGKNKSGPSGPQAQGPQKAGNRLPGSTDSTHPSSGSNLGSLGTASTGPLAQPSSGAAGNGGSANAESSGSYSAGRGGFSRSSGGGGYDNGAGGMGGDGGAPADAELSFNKENAGAEVNPMGSEDPEDYFTRINLEENIFKRIHDKYHKQALAWESRTVDENRKPAAAASQAPTSTTPATVMAPPAGAAPSPAKP